MTTKKQRADITNMNKDYNGTNYGSDKETIDQWIAIVKKGKEYLEPVTVRCYMGRSRNASQVYATIWIHGGHNMCSSGSGRAGGYGYCKSSAAVGDAIRNTGIKLSKSISGVGRSAIEDAITAICKAMGHNKIHIVRA